MQGSTGEAMNKLYTIIQRVVFSLLAEVRPPSVQVDQWTLSERGCPCHWDPSHQRACACCQRYGCQCGRENPNQCVQCGSPHHCGQKEDTFGPNRFCKPKVCPASELLPWCRRNTTTHPRDFCSLTYFYYWHWRIMLYYLRIKISLLNYILF